jgi:predicted MPP superfamily phosphohydrolase
MFFLTFLVIYFGGNFYILWRLFGHTHNGQIFPFNFYVRRHFPHVKGLYRYKNLHLYVSAGTGTWGPRMRLGSKSEIIFPKLHPPASPLTAHE